MKARENNGISALPTVLIISMVIIEVAIIGVILANIFNNTRFGERLAAEAYSAARSGAQDAIWRVIQEKDCPASSWNFAVGPRSAGITCDKVGEIVTIESTGGAFLRSKKVEAVLGVSSDTGEVSIRSLKEVAL